MILASGSIREIVCSASSRRSAGIRTVPVAKLTVAPSKPSILRSSPSISLAQFAQSRPSMRYFVSSLDWPMPHLRSM